MRPPIAAATLPRRAARLFFRHHVENGVSVAVCLTIVGAAAVAVVGFQPGLFAATGAMCVSIVDQPGRLAHKLPLFALAVAGATLVTLLAGLAAGSVPALAFVVAATGAGMALATAFGRPALTLGIAGVLALVLGMAVPVEATGEVLRRSALFAAGGAGYAGLALLAAWTLDDRNRRLFLSEALRAFARYLHARAELYDLRAPALAALPAVIEAHGAFMERLQAGRDAIFTGRPSPRRRKWTGALVALLDAYEAVLSTDADWETLRTAAGSEAVGRIAGLTRALARDAEALALALVAPAAAPARAAAHEADFAALDDALAAAGAEGARLVPTRDKLAETARRMHRLADALVVDPDHPFALPAVDFRAFVDVSARWRTTLGAHLTFTSPVARYAIRLTLAMLAGYAVTSALPQYVHGGWILLTVALIMRASYALTRQRRNDRIVGTLAGCAVAALLIPVLPPYGLLLVVVAGLGAAHAFATVDYRATSFAASLMALMLVHLLDPRALLVADRIVDTLIGAVLSVVFSRLLPSWEWRDVPRLVARLVEADRNYAAEALATRPRVQEYRLARKRALDAFTALAAATRRLAGEPHTGPHKLDEVNALLGANYLFASDLASVQSLLRMRGAELEPVEADRLLDAARARIADALAGGGSARPPLDELRRRGWAELAGLDAATFLRRRIGHIEVAAERLAALAARQTGTTVG